MVYYIEITLWYIITISENTDQSYKIETYHPLNRSIRISFQLGAATITLDLVLLQYVHVPC